MRVMHPDGTVTAVGYDPCGECPKGTCDQCEFCQFHASFTRSGDPAPVVVNVEDDGSTQVVEMVP